MTKCFSADITSCVGPSRNLCRDCTPGSFKDLKSVLDCFRGKWSPYLESEWAYYRGRAVSDESLRLAARAALDESEARHPHQYRVPNTALDEAEKILLKLKDVLNEQNNFDDLHNLIIGAVQNEVAGFGPMSSYDTAVRIGAMLGLEPEHVYLHAGAAVGAEGVLGQAYCFGKKKLSLSELPVELAQSKLTPDQIESFLCICKKPLNKL